MLQQALTLRTNPFCRRAFLAAPKQQTESKDGE